MYIEARLRKLRIWMTTRVFFVSYSQLTDLIPEICDYEPYGGALMAKLAKMLGGAVLVEDLYGDTWFCKEDWCEGCVVFYAGGSTVLWRDLSTITGWPVSLAEPIGDRVTRPYLCYDPETGRLYFKPATGWGDESL